nr:receptor-type tyrosine-protein phosphatase T-like [Crassostrea gigas]XP_034321389.1 receptor-type tyrosine-protein phosphatase T-like [Crassostrea gigas]
MVVKSNGKDSVMNDSNDSAKLVQPTDSNKEEWNENPIGDNDIYMNEQFTPNIPVDQLDSFIAEKRSKGNEGFKKEYAGLPSGEIRCCDAGKKQENIAKNRFKTTFPYDHSRVTLHVEDESSSDYINANYIDGHNRQKEYIAAQGPKANTLADFWRMIWQENVATIVMLTNLKEGEKFKCTQYWPERNKPFSAGPVLVKLIEEKEFAFYIERKMSVSNKQLKKTRVIYQHHYTAWPDHGTPESLCLLTFHNHVISKTNNNTNVPTVVHCSAGVGRTGTYIALDALYHMGKQTGTVNVVEFVKKMRGNRVSMVQTFEQYTTIYLALNNIFKAPIKMDNSTDVFFKAEKAIQGAQATRKEFQLLLNVRPAYTGVDYKIAKQNSAKNCADTILPLDKYSLFLSSSVSNRGNYINAIVVPSLTNGRRFIVTKYPTPDGAVDFLRLLDDHESDTVICMDPVQDIDSIRSWLPDASSSTVVTPFTVHCQSKSKTDVTCHLIDIVQEKNEDESHSVVVVEPRAKIGPIETSQDTSHLRSLVSAALLSETENPITVVCSDGASLCGVFLAVHNAIQQLDIDGWVDVFTTVRHLQVRRPEFCANFNEYQMVFKALYDHIQSTTETIYSNQ